MSVREHSYTSPRPSVKSLLLLRLLIVLAPIVVLQAWVYHHDYQEKREAEVRANLAAARAVAASFTAFLADLRHGEEAASQGLIVLAPFTREQASWYMAQLKGMYPELTSVSWLQPNGLVFASTERRLVGTIWSGRTWRREILHGREFLVTNVTRPRKSQDVQFSVVLGAQDKTKSLRGIVVARVDPNRLGGVITVKRSGSADVSLVDNSGWLVFRSPALPSSYTARDWDKASPILRRALYGKEGTAVATGHYLPGRRIMAAVPIPSVGWAAGAGRPEAEALAPIRAATADSASVFALVAALGVLLATLGARTITAPVDRLRSGARAIGAGLARARVPESGPAELAELTSVFNQMAEQIRAREEELALTLGRLQTLLDTLPVGVIIAEDPACRVITTNPAAARMWEVEVGTNVSASALEPVRLSHRYFSEGHELVPEEFPLQAAVFGDQLVPEREVEAALPSGRRWIASMSAAPLHDASGAVIGGVAVVTDVTELRQAQQERERQQAELLASERARAELAETLNRETSHRVKNNLTMIAGMLQMQRAEQRSPEAQAALRDTTGRIIAFASLHEQFQRAVGDEADLVGILHRIADATSGVFASRHVSISVEGDPISCPRRAATNLAIIANELITNAIKHGAPGADGEFRVAVRVTHTEGTVCLAVWNSGRPIAVNFDSRQQRGVGLRLVSDLVCHQYRGCFTLRPDRGGSLAEICVPQSSLQ